MSRLAAALSNRTQPGPQSSAFVDWPWSGSPPDWWLRGSGTGVEKAIGAPALLGVIRLLSGAMALCPTIVYEDTPSGRQRAEGSWQWDLLHDGYGPDTVPSIFRADLGASLAGCGNFYARKIKVRGQVREHLVLDPRRCKPRRAAGTVVFDVTHEDGGKETLTRSEIIHGRLGAVSGSLEGIAPVTSLRWALDAVIARQEMNARVLENDARPGLVVKTPRKLDEAQADEWADKWMARHGGANAGRPTILGENDDIVVLPVNLKDLQFVEQHKVGIETIGGAYNLTPVFLGAGDREPTYEDRLQMTTFALGPIMQAVQDALTADRDLFPRQKNRMFVELLPDALLRVSIKERYEAFRLARQGGWITANEIRDLENKPPVEGGDQLQETPVGGAPNPGRRSTDE